MRFKLLSDLHLEFYSRYRGGMFKQTKPWIPTPEPEDQDTVLLLAGDIHVGPKGLEWIERMAKRFLHVVYIAGNHEFYNQEYYETLDFWQDVELDNFTFLEQDYMIIEDVRIFGAVLWTNVTDGFNIWHGSRSMNDYQVIKFNHMRSGYIRKLNVQDTNNIHLETVKNLRKWLETPWEGKTIVMTHHLPHPLCVHEKWKGSNLNDFFMTNLDDIIEQYDIDYWVHGHTHDNVDVEVHGTRILCNPMGYHGVQLNQDFNEGLTFDTAKIEGGT